MTRHPPVLPIQSPPSLDHVVSVMALAEAPGLGNLGARKVLEDHGDPCRALHHDARCRASRALMRGCQGDRLRARALRFIAAGGRVVTLCDNRYPDRFRFIPWAPPWLFLRGALSTWPERTVTVVGTRRASPSALALTSHVVRALAERSIAVCSGLAFGIDAAAHRGTLEAGGTTMAVVGTGLDVCYPAAHRGLAERIGDTGLLISEHTPGTGPKAYHFPRRNRILAALADVVVVIQAPEKSGALITARHALDVGIDVLAAPGDPLLPEGVGSNRLIADGARPVLQATDVVAAVLGEGAVDPTTAALTVLPEQLSAFDRRVLQVLDLSPRDSDGVARQLGCGPAQLLARVAALELDGFVESTSGGGLRLTPAAAAMDRWGRSGPETG